MMSMYLVVPLTTPRVFTTLAFAEFWEDRNRGNNISTVGIIVIGRICCVIVFRPFSSDDCVKSIKMLGFQVVIMSLVSIVALGTFCDSVHHASTPAIQQATVKTDSDFIYIIVMAHRS